MQSDVYFFPYNNSYASHILSISIDIIFHYNYFHFISVLFGFYSFFFASRICWIFYVKSLMLIMGNINPFRHHPIFTIRQINNLFTHIYKHDIRNDVFGLLMDFFCFLRVHKFDVQTPS